MASQEAQNVQAQMRAFGAGTDKNVERGWPSIDEIRTHVAFMGECATQPEGVVETTIVIGGNTALLQTPENALPGKVFLWIHGGGYNLLSARSHARMCAHFAKASRIAFAVLDYRQAPENPFPAALDDAVGAYRALRQQGYSWVGLGGDSAGAGQALAAMLVVRESGEKLPDACVFISGWFDLTMSLPSFTDRVHRDPINHKGLMKILRDNYLAGHAADDPRVSPLFGDFGKLPRLYIVASEEEILHDDSYELARRSREAGVDVTFKAYEGVPHVHTLWAGNMPEADDTVDRVAKWL